MSAIHTGSVTARLRADGLYEYTGTSEDRIITGWSALGTDQRVHVTIPAQRAGDAYDAVVLNPAATAVTT